MKRYLRLVCTTCKREVDQLIDLTHFAPDRCVITLGCEGRLQPIEPRSNGTAKITSISGLQDWRPRGQDESVIATLVEDSFVPLHTGEYNQLVVAVPENEDEIALEFKTAVATPKAFRQYVFRLDGAFKTVAGVESGLEKKTLRFSAYGQNPDLVEVYVNGVKRERGLGPDDYQLATSATSGIPENAIVFNSVQDFAGQAQVDVIVSKEAPNSVTTFYFRRHTANEARTGAYENISAVKRFVNGEWKTFHLYSYEPTPVEIQQGSTLVPVARDGFFLLASPPYSKFDRNPVRVVPLSGFSAERDYIKSFLENGTHVAKITKTSLENVYPPLKFEKFFVEPVAKIQSEGSSDAIKPSLSTTISGPAL